MKQRIHVRAKTNTPNYYGNAMEIQEKQFSKIYGKAYNGDVAISTAIDRNGESATVWTFK